MASNETFTFRQKIDDNSPIILVDVDETLYNKAGLNLKLIEYLKGKPNIFLFTKMDIQTINTTIYFLMNDHFTNDPKQKMSSDIYYIRLFLCKKLLELGVYINGIITPSDINTSYPGEFYELVFMHIDKFILNYKIEEYNDSNTYNGLNEKKNTKLKLRKFNKYKNTQIENLQDEVQDYLKSNFSPELLAKNFNDDTKAKMFVITYNYFMKNKNTNSPVIYIDDNDLQLNSVLVAANDLKKKLNIDIDLIALKSITEDKNINDDDVIFLNDYEKAINEKRRQNMNITNTTKNTNTTLVGGSKLKIHKYKIKTNKIKKNKSKTYKNKTHKYKNSKKHN